MNRKKWLICGLILLITALIAVGCPRKEPQPAPGDGEPPPVDLDINALVEQWVQSNHSNILLFPAQRDGCVGCHDGGAFAGKLTEQAAVDRDYFIAIDCRACHSGQGAELMEAGTVTIPTAENVNGGTGAQCMACHNERRAPEIGDPNRSAPHYSSQAGVYTATGGIRKAGFDYGSTQAHVGVDNTCVRCHMTQAEEGFASHSFRVDNVQAACGECHQNITTVNLAAREDYDGNGETKGIQDEVEGLLNLVQQAVGEALDGGSFATAGGAITFTDATGAAVTAVPDEVYQAAYNHVLVTNDGSLGVHNPLFIVQLLQQSYKALTGEDVPGATMR